MRSRSLVALAIAVTVVPAVAQAAESAAEDPGGAPVAQDLRESVRELGNRARGHSTRLGLRPAALPAPAATASALRRQERRLREVVAFLSGREEIALPVDQRPAPRALPRGRDLETRVAYEHRRATRLALRLGLEQPGPLAPEAGPADRRDELARWTAIARWLSARAERVTEDERPMSERVPHYEELTCIAEHESGGRWDISTGNGYYGGLQMDRQFQQTYAPDLYEAKGTADTWTQEEQMRAAAGAVEERGFTPWPTAARMCGLL
jgi:Transglycosylase-like domain